MFLPRRTAISLVIALTCFLSPTLSAQESTVERPYVMPPVATGYMIEVRRAEACLFAPIDRIASRRSGAPAGNAPGYVEPSQQTLANTDAASREPLPQQNVAPDVTSQYPALIRGHLQFTLPRPARYLPDRAGSPIISHVNFSALQIGELWRVRVSVGSGEFFDAGDHQVADLVLRTNERAEVTNLARFGVSPFRVGVVKVIGELVGKPYVNTKAPSVSVEKIEASARPGAYRVSLRNNSEKNVLALQYNTYKNHRFLFLKWVENSPIRPLVKAGEVYNLEASSEDQKCGEADGYRQSQADRIEVTSVVFADGSYEGDSGLAGLIRGQALGNKNHLERVVAALSNLGSGEPDTGQLIFQLKYLHDTLEEAAPPYLVDSLRNGMPPTNDPDAEVYFRNLIRHGQHEIKSSVQSDAAQLERMSKSQNIEALKRQSALVVAKYKTWLAASEAVAVH